MSQQICSYPQFIIRTTDRKGSEWFGLYVIHHRGSSALDAVPCSHVTKINAFKRQQMCLSVRRLNRDRAFPVVHLVMIWKKVLVRYAMVCGMKEWSITLYYSASAWYFIWRSGDLGSLRGIFYLGILPRTTQQGTARPRLPFEHSWSSLSCSLAWLGSKE